VLVWQSFWVQQLFQEAFYYQASGKNKPIDGLLSVGRSKE